MKIACLSLPVNVSAPILTEPGGPATRQPTFHPFATAARLAAGTSLRTVIDCESLTTARHGSVPAIAAAATLERAAGRAAISSPTARPTRPTRPKPPSATKPSARAH